MNLIHFQLVTPERVVLSEELESLTCPTTMGEITVMPGHSPLVATLAAGELKTYRNNERRYIHVAGGFIEVRRGSEVVVLADAAEHAHEIDVAQTQEAIARAQRIMQETRKSDLEYARAASMLEANLSRLRVAKKHAHRRTASITGKGVLDE